MAELLPFFDNDEIIVDVSIPGVVTALKADPDRWSFVVSNRLGNVIFAIRPETLTVANAGILITSTNSPMVFDYRKWGPLINSQWYCQGEFGAGVITIQTTSQKR